MTAAPTPIMSSGAGGYPYDRNVQFDWPETTPMAGECLPGTYTGQFSCVEDTMILGKWNFSGPITFTLTASPTGEFLEITNGTLTGSIAGVPLMADLVGKLDCGTNEIRATTENGTVTILISSMKFNATLKGHLDRLTGTMTGTWTLAPDFGLGAGGAGGAGDAGTPPFPCTGPWSVTRQ